MSDFDPQATCPTCGKGPFKNAFGWAAHQRSKGHPGYAPRPQVEEVEDEPLVPVVVTTGPFTPGAVRFNDPEGPRNWGIKGIRKLKMVYARDDEWQKEDNGPGWWHRAEKAGRQPFFTPDHYAERTISEPIGPVMEDGSQEVRQKTIKVKIPGSPNFIQEPYTGRHNGNDVDAMRKARGEGRRLPEEVGLAPRCQLSECWVKLNVTETDIRGEGGYCCEDHRKAATSDRGGVMLEVLNEKKKERQWATL